MDTKEKAIKKLGCREKECKFFDEKSCYSFCKAIFTKDCCINSEEKIQAENLSNVYKNRNN